MKFCDLKYKQSCAVENIYILTVRGSVGYRVSGKQPPPSLQEGGCSPPGWVNGAVCRGDDRDSRFLETGVDVP